MNFGNLKSLFRAYVPAATINALKNENIEIILNEGALDVAVRTQCLKNFAYFNAEAGINKYSLSTKLSRYLGIEESGVWFLEDGQYTELYPKTLRELDNKRPNWRSETGDSIQEYAIFGDWFMPVPYPETALSNAFLIYYFERPMTMTDPSDFPFHIVGVKTTERSDLAILSDCILLYAEAKVLKLLSKRQDSAEKYNEYLATLEMVKPFIQARPDIVSHRDTKWQGPRA
jgi:hypothetical protein